MNLPATDQGSRPVIHCTAPGIHLMDAVGNFCLDLADCLEAAGFSTKLYANSFPRRLLGKVCLLSDLFPSIRPDDLILVSYSIFDTCLRSILELPNPKVCYFHGVTPPELLQEFDPMTAEVCRKAMRQLPRLAMFDVVLANSSFSASVLAPHLAGRTIGIAPPVFPSRLARNASAPKNDAAGLTLLFVGRIVPHKRIEDLFNVLAEIRRVDSSARLIVVGGGTIQPYSNFLRSHATRLGIPEDKIMLTGKVTDAELPQYYSAANAFLFMSLHEGFGIPVLEAMGCGLPVFVREGNAAAEVAGDAGVRFRGDDSAAIAGMILRTLSDHERCGEMVRRGRVRYEDFMRQNTPAFWKSVCDTARAAAGGRG